MQYVPVTNVMIARCLADSPFGCHLGDLSNMSVRDACCRDEDSSQRHLWFADGKNETENTNITGNTRIRITADWLT